MQYAGEATDLVANLDSLIQRWCDRRALRPIQCLLRAYPGPLWHAYHRLELLETLQDVRRRCRADLTDEEVLLIRAMLKRVRAGLQPAHASP